MRAIAKRLRAQLAETNALHESYLSEPLRRAAYERFVGLQIGYFLPQYEDLRSSPAYSEAIDFIISDMVGPSIAARDAQLSKVVPMMGRVLPTRALEALAVALELNATVLRINLGIEDALRERLTHNVGISEYDYCLACRDVASFADFERLIAMTREAGESLNAIVKLPMIATTLKVMRGPAGLMRVDGLHEFLESGFRIFRSIDDIPEFLDIVEARMSQVFGRVFDAPADSLGTTPLAGSQSDVH